RLSGDWRAIKRAPIALDRLPPPARLHPSDQGRFQGRAPLRLLHPLKKIQKRHLSRQRQTGEHAAVIGMTPLSPLCCIFLWLRPAAPALSPPILRKLAVPNSLRTGKITGNF
ncbi:MAG TPA: hypothetical protein VKT99_10800, partial [Xanthobacteraceae bacterium]|nr:hypothetical protein [Xanthobacteraceae bacterium]